MVQRKSPGNRRKPVDFIRSVGELLTDLIQAGPQPTLVGGMALVTLGSKRVTKDFDFLVGADAREQAAVIEVFYKHGFQLASRLDQHGEVVSTIDNQGIASTRLRIDKPHSAYFYNHTLALRVDLLFDFPIPAQGVYERSTQKKIQSYSFRIASREDLIRMKEIAAEDRKLSSDLQDLEFLKKE